MKSGFTFHGSFRKELFKCVRETLEKELKIEEGDLGARRRGTAPKLLRTIRVGTHEGGQQGPAMMARGNFDAPTTAHQIHSTVHEKLTLKLPSRKFVSERLFDVLPRKTVLRPA